MEPLTWTAPRRTASMTRKRPRPPHWFRFAAASDGAHAGHEVPKPTEVFVEATLPDGETAEWLDDRWWMECLSCWKDDILTIHILPSPAALLHPVVLHHVEMVRRVAPHWRVVGHVYLEELDLDASPDAVAGSPYHEVRIIDAPMAGTLPGNPARSPKLQDLFGGIRRAQSRLGVTLPILVRATAPPDAGYEWPGLEAPG